MRKRPRKPTYHISLPPAAPRPTREDYLASIGGPRSASTPITSDSISHATRAKADTENSANLKSKSRSCPCDGSNENCSHCFGTGSVTGRLMEHPASTGAPESRTGIDIVIPSAPLRHAAAQISRNRQKRRKHRSVSSEPAALPMKATSAGPFNPLPLSGIVNASATRRALTQCPVCGVPVRKTRLTTHLWKVHRETDSHIASTRGHIRASVDGGHSPAIDPGPGPQEERRAERKLDGSRDYYQIREAGRF